MSTISINASNQAVAYAMATTSTESVATQTTATGSVGNTETWTFSFYARATATNARLTAAFQPLTSGGSNNGSEITGTQTTLSTSWQRITVTGTTPGSSNSKAQVIIRAANSSASSVTIYVRNAQFERASSASPFRVAAETVNLDPATTGFSKMIPVYNPGSAPAPMTITAKFPDASTNVQAVDYWLATTDGIAGNKYLADYLNGPYYAQAEANGNGWTLTAGTDTTLAGTTDATHSPGSGTTVARITHSTDPTTYAKRITFSRSTVLDCLRGSHRVFVAVKPASLTNYRLQLAWSAGGSTTETNDEFLLQQTNNTAVARVLCDLGTIEIPSNTNVTLAALTLELWTKMGVGKSAANLDIDYIMLVPQDNAAHVEAADADTSVTIGTRGRDLGTPKNLGAESWSAGTALSGGSFAMRLDANNEAAGIGSTSTGAWTSSGASGVVRNVAWNVHLNNFIGTVKISIGNQTAGTVDYEQTYTYSVASNAVIQLSTNFTDAALAGKVYQPRVAITSYTSGSVDVWNIYVTPITAITQNQQIRSDPGSTGLDRYAAERLDSSGFYVGALTADRVPFWVPPGLSLLWVEAYDLSVGGAELPHLNARTVTITPTVYPRYWS